MCPSHGGLSATPLHSTEPEFGLGRSNAEAAAKDAVPSSFATEAIWPLRVSAGQLSVPFSHLEFCSRVASVEGASQGE